MCREEWRCVEVFTAGMTGPADETELFR